MKQLRTLLIIAMATFACALAHAQGVNVSGKVTSATDGEPWKKEPHAEPSPTSTEILNSK